MRESTIKKKKLNIFLLFILSIALSIYLFNKKNFYCKMGYFITKRIEYLKKIKKENFLIYYKIFLDN